jgi:hypothetical protein
MIRVVCKYLFFFRLDLHESLSNLTSEAVTDILSLFILEKECCADEQYVLQMTSQLREKLWF